MPRDRIDTAPTVAGCIREGVPPPKKMVETVRSERAPASPRSRRERAHEPRLVDRGMADVAVEVAYGHFDRQNGQCT